MATEVEITFAMLLTPQYLVSPAIEIIIELKLSRVLRYISK